MEVNRMTGKRILSVVFALIIVVGFVLGGVAIYQAGFTQGAMTNLALPEGSEAPVVPYRHVPYAYGFGPRIGLFGLFPLFCFGGFFFLLLFFGFGFFARRRAWMRWGPEAYHHWKHYGPPHWDKDRPESEPSPPPAETEES
jgi:hypothetical protein